ARTDAIGDVEAINGTSKFIGEVVGTAKDFSPTIKYIDKLSKARGLAPNNPENQGSYYAAGVAHFGKSGSLQTVGGKNIPSVDTYSLLLPSPNSTVRVPFPDGRVVTIIPFAKTVSENNGTKGQYQTTNQYVGIYVTEATTTPGSYSLKFYVNFEDHSAGGDFEMDAVAYYEIVADNSSISVRVEDNANDSAGVQNMGYIISGTTRDGAYLVVQDRAAAVAPATDIYYYLNVPDGASYWAGYCDPAGPYGDHHAELRCRLLPNKASGSTSFKTFGLAPAGAATPVLKHPLWYAARWGGYGDTAPTAPLPDGQTPSHYIEITNHAGLKSAFYTMFQDVLDHGGTVGAVTSMGKELETSSRIFTTSFNQSTLVGDVVSSKISVVPALPSARITFTRDWSAIDKMPAPADRKIYYRDPGSVANALAAFTYENLSSAGSGYPLAYTNRDVVNYLRGDTSKEVRNGGTLRNRLSILGTTINSAPMYSKDTNMVYVGANDGMLHAFDAESGAEKFAFIPTSIVSKSGGGAGTLSWLANQDIRHRFYLDGALAITDKYTPGSGMAAGYNYLVGFLGRGGKGLFGLPVNSSSVKLDGGVWEINGGGDNHMGYLLGKPVIELLPDGTNVVIFGNGYNSANNQAALYVLNAANGTLLAKFVTCTGGPVSAAEAGCASVDSPGSPNGLATPGVLRRDGRVQQVYAGDYLGNVWKFDLSGLTQASRDTYYLSDARIKKIFTAKTAAGVAQHIVAPMVTSFSSDSVDRDTQDKQFVFFGTGSDLTVADLSNTTTAQTMYGLIDDGGVAPPLRSEMRQRTIGATGVFSGYKNGASLSVRAFSAVQNDMTGKRGWYMDWTTPSGAGIAPVEQVFTEAALRTSVTPTLVVSSAIANSASCVSTGAGYLNAMDAYRGGSLAVSYFDINRDGQRNETFTAGAALQQVSSIDFGIGEIGKAGFTGANVIVQGSGPTTGGAPNTGDVGLFDNTIVSRRTSWRELNN
ncbi:MAG: pilus assembly protein, partial [Rhodoferax sp.]